MNKTNFAASLLLFILCHNSPKASLIAPQKIYCTHPQVCNLAKSILPLSGDVPELILAYKPHGDIHEATPTASEMKNLASSEYLIIGPSELHPWSKKLLDLRKNKMGSTLILKIQKEKLENYPNYKDAPMTSLAHFWLYPEIAMELQKNLAQEFANRFGLQASEEPSGLLFFRETQHNLNSKLSKLKGALVIVTHNALVPLLKENGALVFSLKANEQGEVPPLILKKLEENLKKAAEEKTIWILEKNISVSSQIQKLIKPTHKKIEVMIEGSMNEKLESPLTHLFEKIEALK